MGYYNFADRYNTIFIKYCGNTSFDDEITIFKDSRKGYNTVSISISNFTLDNIFVYKSTNVKHGLNRYWFVNNNKIYMIVSIEPIIQMDKIVTDLIKFIN